MRKSIPDANGFSGKQGGQALGKLQLEFTAHALSKAASAAHALKGFWPMKSDLAVAARITVNVDV